MPHKHSISFATRFRPEVEAFGGRRADEPWSGTENGAPVCITGMHRSGTSTVAQLLYRCGLYLGREDQILASGSDNPDGYWEHKGFRAINQRILESYGGGWDLPPSLPPGWHLDERLRPVRSEAQALLREFEGREPWGWKDPRNSLNLQFWTSLLPEAKVVICLRNPLEVALSLRRRAMSSYAFSLNLWTIYNQRLLEVLPEDRYIVTHYEAYLYRPTVELRRVLDFLRLPASDILVARARSSTLKPLRHHHVTTQELLEANVPEETFRLYLRLCRYAGWDYDRTYFQRLTDVKRDTADNAPA